MPTKPTTATTSDDIAGPSRPLKAILRPKHFTDQGLKTRLNLKRGIEFRCGLPANRETKSRFASVRQQYIVRPERLSLMAARRKGKGKVKGDQVDPTFGYRKGETYSRGWKVFEHDDRWHVEGQTLVLAAIAAVQPAGYLRLGLLITQTPDIKKLRLDVDAEMIFSTEHFRGQGVGRGLRYAAGWLVGDMQAAALHAAPSGYKLRTSVTGDCVSDEGEAWLNAFLDLVEAGTWDLDDRHDVKVAPARLEL